MVHPSAMATDQRQVRHLQRMRERGHPHSFPLLHHRFVCLYLHGAVGLRKGVDGTGRPRDRIRRRRSIAARHEIDEHVLMPPFGRVISDRKTSFYVLRVGFDREVRESPDNGSNEEVESDYRGGRESRQHHHRSPIPGSKHYRFARLDAYAMNEYSGPRHTRNDTERQITRPL
jgi:hypothetical protein